MEKAEISWFLTIWLFLPCLAFFTLFGFFWAWFDFFFSNDVWQPCLSSMERLKASLTAK